MSQVKTGLGRFVGLIGRCVIEVHPLVGIGTTVKAPGPPMAFTNSGIPVFISPALAASLAGA
jgi:hypothetical protein